MIKERFELTKPELDSAVWKRLKVHLQERLNVMRQQNDIRKTEEDTAFLRGQILAVKELLSLEKE